MARYLTPAQWASLWVEEGGPRDQAAMYAVVVKHESGGNAHAVNSQSGATGGPQIHPGGEQYKDPRVATRVAVAKWKERGWIPWSVCGSHAWDYGEKTCPKLQPEAARLAKRLKLQPAGFGLPTPPVGPSLPDLGGKVPNPLDGLGALAEGIGNIAEIWRGLFETWLSLLKKITDPQTWIDAGKILLGLILLKMGLSRLFQVVT